MEKNILKKDVVYICKHCGKEFSRTKRKNDDCLFCGRKCSDEYRKIITQQKRENEEKEKVREVKCSVCGKIFTTKIKNVKCCSKECREEANRITAREAKEKAYIKTVHICVKCGKEFVSEYKDKRRKYCSDKCGKSHNRKRNKHRRRMRSNKEFDNSISLNKLYEEHNGICAICGIKCDYEDYRTTEEGYFIAGNTYPSIDHIKPLSNGGTHTKDNVQLLCIECNQKKSNK